MCDGAGILASDGHLKLYVMSGSHHKVTSVGNCTARSRVKAKWELGEGQRIGFSEG